MSSTSESHERLIKHYFRPNLKIPRRLKRVTFVPNLPLISAKLMMRLQTLLKPKFVTSKPMVSSGELTNFRSFAIKTCISRNCKSIVSLNTMKIGSSLKKKLTNFVVFLLYGYSINDCLNKRIEWSDETHKL